MQLAPHEHPRSTRDARFYLQQRFCRYCVSLLRNMECSLGVRLGLRGARTSRALAPISPLPRPLPRSLPRSLPRPQPAPARPSNVLQEVVASHGPRVGPTTAHTPTACLDHGTEDMHSTQMTTGNLLRPYPGSGAGSPLHGPTVDAIILDIIPRSPHRGHVQYPDHYR